MHSALEASSLPVVAALHGTTLRGGLETAPQPPSLYGEAATSQHDIDYIFTHQPVLALSRSGL